MENKLEELIKALPEIYQKIYLCPEYDKTSRLCQDREEVVICTAKNLKRHNDKKRPKVLDIGCAQGYFSLKLDELGCEVDAIDYFAPNIDLCKYLNERYERKVNFKLAELTIEYVEAIPDGYYDIVLLFSVIHHVAYFRGYDYAVALISRLALKTKILLSEFALKEEPVYWNTTLPIDSRDWLKSFSFNKEIARFGTHLSSVKRPLFFSSNCFVHVNGNLYRYDTSMSKSFKDSTTFSHKKYYMSDGIIIKYFKRQFSSLLSSVHYDEIQNEQLILSCYKEKISFAPDIIDFERGKYHIIIVLALNKGKLLYDKIRNNEKINNEKIIMQILDNLIELENLGLYHTDIRLWNVVVKDDEKAFLIDFGAVSVFNCEDGSSRQFGVDEISTYDSFMIFVYDLIERTKFENIQKGGLALERKSLYSITDNKYFCFFQKINSIEKNEISFKRIKNEFEKIVINGEFSLTSDEKNDGLYKEVGKLQKDYNKFRNETFMYFNQIEKKQNQMIIKYEELSREFNKIKGKLNK